MLSLEIAHQWYSLDDAVHGFDHIERVYHLCEKIGEAEGANLDIVRSAALLHDSQGSAPDGSERPDHHLLSAEFAGEVLKNEGWIDSHIQAVQHCIRAHRFRHNGEEPASIEARVLFDADKLDVIGAIGVARTLGFALKAGTPIFSEPSRKFIQTGEKEPDEPHSAYHEYLFKLRKISSSLYTETGRHLAIKRQRFLNQYFDELAAEYRGQH